jgi:hypothetical protein
VKWLALVAITACGGDDHQQPIDALVLDDGNCAHVAGTPVAVGTITDIGTTELSGLAISRTLDNVLWTHDDAGGTADIFSINAANAAVLGTLHLTTGTNVDWEDIATAPCAAGHCIYISDTGDNDLDRATVAIYEVVEPATTPIGSIDVTATKYDIMYPDGPHNVESLFVDPRDGKSYAIVKNDGKKAAVFEMPRIAGSTGLATQIGQLDIPADDPRVTAADMTVDDCSARILVRTYGPLYELRGTATSTVAELLSSALAKLPVADEAQGEAVAYSVDGRAYYTTSEGKNPTLTRVAD